MVIRDVTSSSDEIYSRIRAKYSNPAKLVAVLLNGLGWDSLYLRDFVIGNPENLC